jgi:hypothetical protein
MKKFIFITTLLILLIGAGAFYWRYYYVFGEGVKAGELNFMVKKGMVFKTWEGRLIQTGYRSLVPGSVQSNEFEFSVTNDKIAETLKLSGGKVVELQYKEYFGGVPWRGNSKYIVDSIIAIHEKATVGPTQYP